MDPQTIVYVLDPEQLRVFVIFGGLVVTILAALPGIQQAVAGQPGGNAALCAVSSRVRNLSPGAGPGV